jgi:long-chain fatty acid transport protein
MFNLIGFPAITEHHITLGLGYEFTKNFGIDLAYKHAFNKKVRATDGSGNLWKPKMPKMPSPLV